MRWPIRQTTLLLVVAALANTSVSARDLQCETTQQAARRVICDHAILNNEYDSIYEQQQALLAAGKLSNEDLIDWQQLRDACTDVHCIDGVFAQWTTMAQSLQAGQSVTPEPSTREASPNRFAPADHALVSAPNAVTAPPAPSPSTRVPTPSASPAQGDALSKIGAILVLLGLIVLGLLKLFRGGQSASSGGKQSNRRDQASARKQPEKPVSVQIFKNERDVIIGRIKPYVNGQLVVVDSRERMLGFYDPKTNKTRDSRQRVIGTGNLLPALLQQGYEASRADR